MSWKCDECGASNSPLLLQCLCTNNSLTTPVTAPTTPTTTASTTSNNGVVEEKALGSKTLGSKASGSKSLSRKSSTKRTYTEYNDNNFNNFWNNYPQHKGKAAAFACWKKVVAAGADPQQLIEGALRYRNDPERDPNFTKWPEGWLNDGRWTDEPVEAPPRTLNSVDSSDPAYTVGTPEYEERMVAEGVW